MLNKKTVARGLAIVAKMAKAVGPDNTFELKVCIHGNPESDPFHHNQGITFWIEHHGNEGECPGCFGSRMCDAYNAAVDRIWALLAPIARENLDSLNSSSAQEVSIPEMLVRSRMAWELAEDMSFASGYGDLDNVMAADEAEVRSRAKRLDGPIRKLLEKTGGQLGSSQDLAGKLKRVTSRYLEIRQRIETILNRQDRRKKKVDAEAKKTDKDK